MCRRPLLAWYEGAVVLWLRWHWPAMLLSPEGFSMLTTRVSRVVVVHDLSYRHRPRTWAVSCRATTAVFLPRFYQGAAQLEAVFDTTRQDVARQLGLNIAGSRVAHHAPVPHFPAAACVRASCYAAAFQLGAAMFSVCEGLAAAQGDLANLLRAFALFKVEGGAVVADIQLLLTIAGGAQGLESRPYFCGFSAITARRAGCY